MCLHMRMYSSEGRPCIEEKILYTMGRENGKLHFWWRMHEIDCSEFSHVTSSAHVWG
jgi:hypothetical protein